jgi:hypothetical protein
MYGVVETNPLVTEFGGAHPCESLTETVSLGDRRLAGITRLRLLTERGYPFMDISYCYGVLKDGSPVRVQVTTGPLSRKAPKADLIAWAKAEGAYAKGLGLLDEGNWSVLYG